jgi:CRP-like cAMP-binding protein
MTDDMKGLRDRLGKQGEEALGRFAQELLENPLVSGAITRAFDARERAAHAQEAAMGALNIPSAADVERLTRRLRSVAQRLEGIEDALDRLDRRLDDTAPGGAPAQPQDGVEERLAELTAEVRRLAVAIESPSPVPREQERLEVDERAAEADA